MTSTPTITDYLKYARLQMAAETFLINEKTGATRYSGPDLVTALREGNNHASRFTAGDAQQFADGEWNVVQQRPNSTSGFSGTLFRNKNTGELIPQRWGAGESAR